MLCQDFRGFWGLISHQVFLLKELVFKNGNRKWIALKFDLIVTVLVLGRSGTVARQSRAGGQRQVRRAVREEKAQKEEVAGCRRTCPLKVQLRKKKPSQRLGPESLVELRVFFVSMLQFAR